MSAYRCSDTRCMIVLIKGCPVKPTCCQSFSVFREQESKGVRWRDSSAGGSYCCVSHEGYRTCQSAFWGILIKGDYGTCHGGSHCIIPHARPSLRQRGHVFSGLFWQWVGVTRASDPTIPLRSSKLSCCLLFAMYNRHEMVILRRAKKNRPNLYTVTRASDSNAAAEKNGVPLLP